MCWWTMTWLNVLAILLSIAGAFALMLLVIFLSLVHQFSKGEHGGVEVEDYE